MSSTIKLDAFALVLNRPRSDIYIYTIEIKKKKGKEMERKKKNVPSSCIRSRQRIDFKLCALMSDELRWLTYTEIAVGVIPLSNLT